MSYTTLTEPYNNSLYFTITLTCLTFTLIRLNMPDLTMPLHNNTQRYVTLPLPHITGYNLTLLCHYIISHHEPLPYLTTALQCIALPYHHATLQSFI